MEVQTQRRFQSEMNAATLLEALQTAPLYLEQISDVKSVRARIRRTVVYTGENFETQEIRTGILFIVEKGNVIDDGSRS